MCACGCSADAGDPLGMRHPVLRGPGWVRVEVSTTTTIHTRLDRKMRGEKGSQGEKGNRITPSSKIRDTAVKKRMKKGSDRKFLRYVETSYKEEKLHFSAKSFRKVFGNVRKCRKCDAQKRTLTKFGVFSQILIGIPSGFEAFCHFCEICMFF